MGSEPHARDSGGEGVREASGLDNGIVYAGFDMLLCQFRLQGVLLWIFIFGGQRTVGKSLGGTLRCVEDAYPMRDTVAGEALDRFSGSKNAFIEFDLIQGCVSGVWVEGSSRLCKATHM